MPIPEPDIPQWLRFTKAQNSLVALAEGKFVFLSDYPGTLVYHDGVTLGGHIVGKVPDGIDWWVPGKKWTARAAASVNGWYAVKYANGLYVAVGNTVCMTSVDGLTWTSRTMPAGQWLDVAYGNGVWVAAANTGTTTSTMIAKSTDGAVTWAAVTMPADGVMLGLKFGNGIFMACGGPIATGGSKLFTSPDGATWTDRSPNTTGETIVDVAYGNGVWVAIVSLSPSNTTKVLTSTDNGVSWSTVTLTGTALSTLWQDLIFGDGKFVVISQTGKVMESTNGTTWGVTNLPESNTFRDIAYGNGLYVAVASTGTNRIAISTDAIEWTMVAAPEANQWFGVCYGNGLWVGTAVNGTNRLMTSGK